MKLMNVLEAAKVANVSRQTVTNWIRRGWLKRRTIEVRVEGILEAELLALVKKHATYKRGAWRTFKMLKSQGMTTKEIAEMYKMKPTSVRAALARHRDDL